MPWPLQITFGLCVLTVTLVVLALVKHIPALEVGNDTARRCATAADGQTDGPPIGAALPADIACLIPGCTDPQQHLLLFLLPGCDSCLEWARMISTTDISRRCTAFVPAASDHDDRAGIELAQALGRIGIVSTHVGNDTDTARQALRIHALPAAVLVSRGRIAATLTIRGNDQFADFLESAIRPIRDIR